MDLIKICPITNKEIKAIILIAANKNIGLIVVCNSANKLGHCPLKRKYICQFPLNPERRHVVQ